MDRYLLCEIDDDSFKEFHELLVKGKGTFYLDIASDGGDSNAMFSFHDLIKIQQSLTNRKIVGTAIGRCQSAAVLILAACSTRFSTPNTIFMVHEDSYELDGSHGDTRKAVEQHQIEEDLWTILMAQSTIAGVTVWQSLARNSTYFGPQSALDYGLIDKIINVRDK